MTKKNYAKTVIRARMETTGEPYSVAARAVTQELILEIEAHTAAPQEAPVAKAKERKPKLDGPSTRFEELGLFCDRMAILLDLHLSFYQAMAMDQKHVQDKELQEAIAFVLAEIDSKGDMVEAMELRPLAFRGMLPDLLRLSPVTSHSMRAMATMYRNEREFEIRLGRAR